MSRRILYLILACALVAAVVAGCSSSSGPADTTKPPAGPNLIVQNLTAPATASHDDDLAGSVSFEVANTGDQDAGDVTVRVSVAVNDKGDGDVLCAEVTGLSIAAGATQMVSPGSLPVSIDMPIGAAKIRVVVDPDGAVDESTDDDNMSSAAITIAPRLGYLYRWAGTVNVAGAGIPANGAPGQAPAKTSLYWPVDISFDHLGNVYVLDWNNHRVMNVDDDGTFNIMIGGYFGDAADGNATQIGLNHPTHIVETPTGDFLLLAWHNSLIKRYNPSTGYITTICGIYNDINNRKYVADEIPADQAYLDLPVTGVFDAAGNFYFGDQGSMIVRQIDTSGIIHTIAGQVPTWTYFINAQGKPDSSEVRHPGFGGDGGPAKDASLHFEFSQSANPSGRICMDSQENLYIADTSNHCVRMIQKSDGYIYTVAGKGLQFGNAGDGGLATNAYLNRPRDVACDTQDNLYIADTANHSIRRVDAATGIITTVVGLSGVSGSPTTARAVLPLDARLREPYGIDFDLDGNLWIADRTNNVIRVLYQ